MQLSLMSPVLPKTKKGKRDLEMYQTKKGNPWYHGMKIHAGVDAGSGYVHTITSTAANIHDIQEASKLIRKDDHVVYGDSRYIGLEKCAEVTSDPHKSKISYIINRRPSDMKTEKPHSGIN